MLLTIQDLAIIAFIITLIIVFIIYKLLQSNRLPEDNGESKKKTRNSRVIQVLEEKGFKFLRNINELHLNFNVDEKENHIIAARNTALLKKQGKKYLLKIKTSSMEGKRFNSPDIRTPLLEMQTSINADGVILFDNNKDKFQVYNFNKKNKLTYLYLLVGLLFLITIVMLIILLKKSGTL